MKGVDRKSRGCLKTVEYVVWCGQTWSKSTRTAKQTMQNNKQQQRQNQQFKRKKNKDPPKSSSKRSNFPRLGVLPFCCSSRYCYISLRLFGRQKNCHQNRLIFNTSFLKQRTIMRVQKNVMAFLAGVMMAWLLVVVHVTAEPAPPGSIAMRIWNRAGAPIESTW